MVLLLFVVGFVFCFVFFFGGGGVGWFVCVFWYCFCWVFVAVVVVVVVVKISRERFIRRIGQFGEKSGQVYGVSIGSFGDTSCPVVLGSCGLTSWAVLGRLQADRGL